MWTIRELKIKAKADLKLCYWKAVLASFILGIAAGSGGSSAGRSSQNAQDEMSNIQSMEHAAAIFAAIAAAIFLAVVLAALLNIFVMNPLSVGLYKYFVNNTENSEHDQDLSVFGKGFKENYKNTVLVMFMCKLFIFLWSLLFIIPGIVKSYQYRMVKYIIGENPDMSYTEALELSKNMMNGNKWKAFCLDLSFIGWYILGALTLGILIVLYVSPYANFTCAELYQTLKEQ